MTPFGEAQNMDPWIQILLVLVVLSVSHIPSGTKPNL
jgi:hypothetical protein